MKRAVYPGSFDPITLGHVDIIRRISSLFDETIILVANSAKKNYLFTADERAKLVRETLVGIANVKVDIYDGLTVDYLHQAKASVIVRGLRAVVDFEYEMTMASMNKKIAPDVETLLVFASPEFYYISSRGVKEVAMYGGALDGLVPENVKPVLVSRLRAGSGKTT